MSNALTPEEIEAKLGEATAIGNDPARKVEKGRLVTEAYLGLMHGDFDDGTTRRLLNGFAPIFGWKNNWADEKAKT